MPQPVFTWSSGERTELPASLRQARLAAWKHIFDGESIHELNSARKPLSRLLVQCAVESKDVHAELTAGVIPDANGLCEVFRVPGIDRTTRFERDPIGILWTEGGRQFMPGDVPSFPGAKSRRLHFLGARATVEPASALLAEMREYEGQWHREVFEGKFHACVLTRFPVCGYFESALSSRAREAVWVTVSDRSRALDPGLWYVPEVRSGDSYGKSLGRSPLMVTVKCLVPVLDGDEVHPAANVIASWEFWAVEDMVGVRLKERIEGSPKILLLVPGMKLMAAGIEFTYGCMMDDGGGYAVTLLPPAEGENEKADQPNE